MKQIAGKTNKPTSKKHCKKKAKKKKKAREVRKLHDKLMTKTTNRHAHAHQHADTHTHTHSHADSLPRAEPPREYSHLLSPLLLLFYSFRVSFVAIVVVVAIFQCCPVQCAWRKGLTHLSNKNSKQFSMLPSEIETEQILSIFGQKRKMRKMEKLCSHK